MLEKALREALPSLVESLYGPRAIRGMLQQSGVNVVPANFYSNTPSLAEIEESYEYREKDPPYLNRDVFVQQRLQDELAALVEYSAEFDPPDNGDEEKATAFFWNNAQFSFSDAMAYYAYVRRLRPKTVVEIGSGFSSFVALEALGRNGAGRLACIEPFPRPFIEELDRQGRLGLHRMRAQDLTPEALDSMLDDGDILFVDSTHTVKTGSDCLHIYLRLIPAVRKRIHIHVHDVFLPFGLPQVWLLDLQIHWTEQYLLLAWLTDNPRAKVLFGSEYHRHFNPGQLANLMHGRSAPKGGSLWIEYDGRR